MRSILDRNLSSVLCSSVKKIDDTFRVILEDATDDGLKPTRRSRSVYENYAKMAPKIGVSNDGTENGFQLYSYVSRGTNLPMYTILEKQ